MQGLTKRVDALDERAWARAQVAEEVARQCGREVQQQVLALQRDARVSAAGAEEVERCQSMRAKRFEHVVEDICSRLSHLEERSRDPGTVGVEFEHHIEGVEQQVATLSAHLATVCERLETIDCASRHVVLPTVSEGASSAFDGAPTEDSEFAMFRQKVTAQFDDVVGAVATLRIKIDGQHERQSSFAARFESLTEFPTVESFRNDIAEGRARDFREIEHRFAGFDRKFAGLVESMDVDRLMASVEEVGNRLTEHERVFAEHRQATATFQKQVQRRVQPREDRDKSPQTSAPSLDEVAPTLQHRLNLVSDQLELLDDFATNVVSFDGRLRTLERVHRQHQDRGDGRATDVKVKHAPTAGSRRPPALGVSVAGVEPIANEPRTLDGGNGCGSQTSLASEHRRSDDRLPHTSHSSIDGGGLSGIRGQRVSSFNTASFGEQRSAASLASASSKSGGSLASSRQLSGGSDDYFAAGSCDALLRCPGAGDAGAMGDELLDHGQDEFSDLDYDVAPRG